MLKVGIITPIGIVKEKEGLPQGNILSSILCNIMFHSLDIFVEESIVKQYNKGVKAAKCEEYQKAIALNTKESKSSADKKKQILRRKRKEAHKLGLKYTKIDDSYVRVKYIRYADDLLIGIRGSKELVKKILKTVKFFLKSHLHLEVNEDKSSIIHSYSGKIPFLGMLIHNVNRTHIPFRKSREIENKRRKRSRIMNRISALKNRQAKVFRDDCLKLFRNKIETHRENKDILKKEFLKLFEHSAIFNDLKNSSTRTIYREFIKQLQLVTEVKESEKLKTLMKT